MGTTLESIHIPNGDAELVRRILPETVVGMWSERFVSAFPINHEKIGGALARRISKYVEAAVLDATIYDSDVVEFAIYQRGKRVFRHMPAPDGGKSRPDVRKFCALLGLEPEDADRLRKIWNTADAEEQLELTATVLGAPLEYGPDELPEQTVCRDIQKVDEWIKGIAKPPKINNTTQAGLIQEIKHFRLTVNGRDMVRSPFYYMSDEPWFADCIHHKTVWWKTCADGTLTPAGETNQSMHYREEQGRLIGISYKDEVLFDSMGTLPQDFSNISWFYILDQGRTLVPQEGRADHLLTCCDAEGNRLWTHYRDAEYLGCGGEKILLRIDAEREGSSASIVKSVDARTGKTLGWTVLDTHMVHFHGYQDGAWWVSYFEDREDDPRSWLVKLDQDAQILGKTPIESTFLQDMAFSPDGSLAYLYFYQKKVQVIRTDTLTEVGEIKDRSLRIHCGTDRQGRAWMRCAGSTMEAWDRELKTPLARHKLKGVVEGVHFDEAGNLCAAAWDKKKAILRIYKMIEK